MAALSGNPSRPPTAVLRERLRTETATRTRLAVVIVNFCQWRNCTRLVRQLRHSDAFRGDEANIILIDNASPEHPLAERLAKQRGVTLLRNRLNLGFAQAVNRGVQASDSDWVLLLNPDVTVDDYFLDRASAVLDELPERANVGAIGFQLRNADGTPQASAGSFPSFLRTLCGLLRPRSQRKCRHQSLNERGPVDWVTGGCLLVRRDCLEDLNGMDERYFLYYEDVDFCRRAMDRGWQVLYEPGVSVTHHWPLHRREVPAPLRLITRHALLTYARSHWPSLAIWGLGSLIAGEAIMRRIVAHWAGRADDAATYRHLLALIRNIRQDRRAAVASQIALAAASLDAVASSQDDSDGD